MGRKTKEKDMVEYICPKCRTKIVVEKGKRVPSLYCKNCLKSKQLTMLRLIYQKTDQQNTIEQRIGKNSFPKRYEEQEV